MSLTDEVTSIRYPRGLPDPNRKRSERMRQWRSDNPERMSVYAARHAKRIRELGRELMVEIMLDRFSVARGKVLRAQYSNKWLEIERCQWEEATEEGRRELVRGLLSRYWRVK